MVQLDELDGFVGVAEDVRIEVGVVKALNRMAIAELVGRGEVGVMVALGSDDMSFA